MTMMTVLLVLGSTRVVVRLDLVAAGKAIGRMIHR